jgi:hypothetical protein
VIKEKKKEQIEEKALKLVGVSTPYFFFSFLNTYLFSLAKVLMALYITFYFSIIPTVTKIV